MKRSEYLLKIAQSIFPELVQGRFFANVHGTESYFSGLKHAEAELLYRNFYDEFDFAFRIRCTFSLCDQKSKTRWMRQEGDEHFYLTPLLRVVERKDFNYSPDDTVRRMNSFYRANTLILETYSCTGSTSNQLTTCMRNSRLHFFLKEELQVLAAPQSVMQLC